MRRNGNSPSASTPAAALAEELRRTCFAPRRDEEMRVGVEVERLVLDDSTGRPAPIASAGGPSMTLALTALGEREGWSATGIHELSPRFRTSTGGLLSFEPGGQLEYAAPPSTSVSELLRDVRDTLGAVEREFERHGWRLVSLGLDPRTPLCEAPLQLDGERYANMAEYFASLGSAGARMMRQTAALQVNVDRGAEPGRRWRLLQACSPSLIALTANSRVHEGRDTGHASFRADAWRRLDVSRTGLVGVEMDAGSAADAYTVFALSAADMFRRDERREWLPFVAWTRCGEFTGPEWERHLTTLFPEVRPRGWFEIRSCDAIPDSWMALPVAVAVAVAYDPHAAAEAERLLGVPDADLLARAGRSGMDDEGVRTTSLSLVEIALEGCVRLGDPLFDGETIERLRDLVNRVRIGETPGASVIEIGS